MHTEIITQEQLILAQRLMLDRCAMSQFAEIHKKYAPDKLERGGGIA